MDDFPLCRICLIVDVQMYNLRSSPLDKYFEHLFGVNPHKHELLTQVCAECAALINKCYKFREKCINGINILQNMLKENQQISKNDLLLLDRDQCKLSSVITLGIPQNHHVYIYSTYPQDPDEAQLRKHEPLNDNYGKKNNLEDKAMKTYDLQSENNHLFFCGPYLEVQPQTMEIKKEPSFQDVDNIYGKNRYDSDDGSSIETMESEEETSNQLNKRAMRMTGNKTRVMKLRNAKSAPNTETTNSMESDESTPLTEDEQQENKKDDSRLARKSQKKIAKKSQKKISKLKEMEQNRKVKLEAQNRALPRDRWFPCGVCPTAFPAKKELRDHERSHRNQSSYECDCCGETFVRVRALSEHKMIHTGEKPYGCNLCSTSFRRTGDLGRHKRNVHGLTVFD